jgi:hypothetical protein
VIERSPRQYAHRWGEADRPLVATNHYRALMTTETYSSSEIDQTTCGRYDALASFFADHEAAKVVEDRRLLYCLTDPSVIQEITAQHAIIRPRSGEIRLLVPRRLVEG